MWNTVRLFLARVLHPEESRRREEAERLVRRLVDMKYIGEACSQKYIKRLLNTPLSSRSIRIQGDKLIAELNEKSAKRKARRSKPKS